MTENPTFLTGHLRYRSVLNGFEEDYSPFYVFAMVRHAFLDVISDIFDQYLKII